MVKPDWLRYSRATSAFSMAMNRIHSKIAAGRPAFSVIHLDATRLLAGGCNDSDAVAIARHLTVFRLSLPRPA
ncbi:MAG: hypothetical protein ABF868_09855 [Sporolactobacillus sp.]